MRSKTVIECSISLFILLLFHNDCLSASSSLLNFADSIPFPAVDSSIVLRQQQVEINIDQLTGSKNETVQFSLFDDVSIVALLEKYSAIPDGSFVWRGRILDQPGSAVLFVIKETSISGEMSVAETLYHIRTVDDGIQIVQEIKQPVPAGLEGLAELRSVTDEVITLTNEERAKYGLPALAYDSLLAQAAQGHADDMAQNDYFDHISLDGRSPGDRITDAGYIWNYCAENIAAGYADAVSVVNGWINSEGHHANMLSTISCDIGVGYAYNEEHYWVQNFGRRDGVSICPTTPGVGKAPDVVTGTATQLGVDSVQLAGTVNPNGLNTTYYFQVGYTAAYGSTSPMLNAGSGTVPLFVQYTPTGFLPSTTYHYRVVAYNSVGNAYGQDETFMTASQWPVPNKGKLPIGVLQLLLL